MEKEVEMKKKYPSLPSNYVTLVQLQDRWLKAKQEREQEEQRKLQLQKLEEEREEQKRKFQHNRFVNQRHNNTVSKYKTHNQKLIWRTAHPVVEVIRAKAEASVAVAVVVVDDIGNVSTEQEQKSEESTKKKKKKKNNHKTKKNNKKQPVAEVEKEVKQPGAHAPHVIDEKENASARRNSETKETKTEFRPKIKNADRTEENNKKNKKRPGVVEEKEVKQPGLHAPHMINEKENASARRNIETKETRSEFRPKINNADRTEEIERKFGDFSMNSEIKKGDVNSTRTNAGIDRRNREHGSYGGHNERRGYGNFGDRRGVRKPSGSGMVWIRKGEVSDGNAAGEVQKGPK